MAFGFYIKANCKELSGSIYYLSNKGIICKVLQTSEETNITADFPEINISGAYDVSLIGQKVVWVQNNRIFVLSIPTKKISTIKASYFLGPEQQMRSNGGRSNLSPPTDFIIKQGLKSLHISPDGSAIAMNFLNNGISYTKSNVLIKGAPLGQINYEQAPDTCMAVRLMSTTRTNTFGGIFSPVAFGNTAFYSNPSITYARIGEATYRQPPAVFVWEGWKIQSSWQEAMKKFNIKRNGFFPAFSTKGLFAVIYQTEAGWGPVEIFDLNTANLKTINKPGVYEFPMHLSNCQGLSWTPLGDLSIQFSEKIVMITKERIADIISRSGIQMDASVNDANMALNSTRGRIVQFVRQKPEPTAINNSSSIIPETIADNVNAINICWKSKTSFFCLGPDGFVYFWDNGKTEKLFQIPFPKFIYCPLPLLEEKEPKPDQKFEPLFNASTLKQAEITLSTEQSFWFWRTPQILKNFHIWLKNPFSLKIGWKTVAEDGNSANVIVNWSVPEKKDKLFFAQIDQDTFDGKKDPLAYEYKPVDSPFEIVVGANPIAFKHETGNAIMAVKFVKANPDKTATFAISNWWLFGYNDIVGPADAGRLPDK